MRNDWWSAYGSSWSGWPGGGGRSRFFESGEVRLAILSLLSEGPKHGYQLMKEMEERSGGLYKASAGSVYPTLQQLEDEGLIQAEQREGKRAFHITEAGRAELAKDPEAVKRIWRRAEQWEEWGQFSPETMGFIIHSFKPLVKAIWKAAKGADKQPSRADRIREILERARQELEAL
jgi:DNA-binding PadR family transcriptional regulator